MTNKSNHGLAVVILSLVAFCVSFIADASNQSCGDEIPIILNIECIFAANMKSIHATNVAGSASNY